MRLLGKEGLLIVLLLMFQTAFAEDTQKADTVLVIKSEKRLYLLNKGVPFASLSVTFGGSPKGTSSRAAINELRKGITSSTRKT